MLPLKYPIVAWDFDMTIAKTIFPEIIELIPEAYYAINSHRAVGGQNILWTCRTGHHLDEAIEFCYENGMIFDGINCNLPYNIITYHKAFPTVEPDCRKIYADLYIDDKVPGGLDWNLIMNLVIEKAPTN